MKFNEMYCNNKLNKRNIIRFNIKFVNVFLNTI